MVKLPLLRSALLVTTALVVPPAARAGGPQQGGAGLPQGGQFVAGSGRIAAGAGALTVTQSSRTGIVDWRSFSIGAGQRVQVNNGTGATLNRVTGNRPSAIAGTLAATGSVYLVNPQGIVVTPQGKVITGGGFVASTRPADAAGFMQSGTLALSGAGPGTVVNRGTIVAGGSVVLHGAEVANSGTVQAGGQAVLAASKDLVLRPVGDTARVVVRGAAGDVRNEGRIEAAEVALRAVGGNVYALAGNRDGYLRATGTVAREGRVLLVAGGDVQADAPIIADGEKGGSVTVRAGGTARVSGSVSARGSAGQGGRVTVSGQVVAVSGTARIDASGATQGGDVQIGGKPPGKAAAAEPASRRAVPNATETRIDDGARIVADGGKGSGGQIIVWSDQRTTFGGTLSARGGTDGGMAEVSSAGVLDYRGRADLRGGTGRAGTLLLDPTDVMITTGNVPAGVSRIDPAVIADQLIYSNFTLVTGAGEGAGDITVASPLTWISTNTLTLSAYRSINVNAGLTNLHGGSLVLQSDSTGTGTGTVAFGQGGSVKLVGGSTTLLYNPYSYATPTDYSRFVKGGLLPEMLVNTPAQLAAMAGAPNAAYALGRDIDLEGSDFAGVAQFGGLLDGRGHTIRNFTTDTVSEAGAGLFGFLTETASIRDLRMTNAAVYGPGVAGLLAATNAGSIRGVSLEGTVAAGGVAGGVAGLNTGTIAEASVNASVTAGQVAGGIVGWNSGSISNATAAGTVGGSSTVGGGVGSPYGTVGGSVGSPYGTVGKTTAVGTVRSTSTVGGVVGSNDGIIGNTNPNDTVGGSSMVGGIAGISTGAIASVYASNTVSGAGVTGAVLGRNLGTLTAGYAAGGATIPGGASDVTSVPITDTVGTAPLPTTITPGTLPSGFNATAWYVSTAGTPALRNVPEATPYLRLAGQVYSADGAAAPGVPLTIMVDRAFFAGVASDATGTWSLEARGAAEGYNVLALLPSGPLGNTVGTRISQSIDTLDIAPETLRFISGSSAPITTSDLLLARNGFIRPLGRARSLLIPITVSTIYGVVDLGDVDLRMTSPGSFLLDRSYNTSGTMTIDVGGTVTQISPLLVGGLEIKAGGMVTLTNPDNRIRAIEGSAGGIDIVTAGPLDIGPAGLSSSGLASLRVAERLTLYGPLVGSGESLTVQAASLAIVGVTDPFRAGGGGTWRIVLADRGTDPPVVPDPLPTGPTVPLPPTRVAAGPTAATLLAAERGFVSFIAAAGPFAATRLSAPGEAARSPSSSGPGLAAEAARAPGEAAAAAAVSAAASASDSARTADDARAKAGQADAEVPAVPSTLAATGAPIPLRTDGVGAPVMLASLTPGPRETAPAPVTAPVAVEQPAGAQGAVALALDTAGRDSARAIEAAGIAPATEAVARFSARANEVLAAGGSPAQAQSAGVAALRQLTEATLTPGPQPPVVALATAAAAGGAVANPAVAAGLAAGLTPGAALAAANGAAATRTAMQAAAAVPIAPAGAAAAAMSQGGALPAVHPAMAAALASGASPQRAMAIAATAQATAATMTRLAAVALPEPHAAAAAMAQGVVARPSQALLLALASGASPADAMERARQAAATLAAMRAAAEAPGRNETLAALADRAALPGGLVIDRHGVARPDTASKFLAMAAVPTDPGDGGAALAQGAVPAALLERLAQSPDLRAAVAMAFQAGLGADGALAVARERIARRESMLAQAAVEADALLLQLAGGSLDNAYLRSLAAGGDTDRFTAALGMMLQQRTPPDAAVRLARQAASPPGGTGNPPTAQVTRTDP